MYGFRMKAERNGLELVLRPYVEGEERYMLPGMQSRPVTQTISVPSAQTLESEREYLQKLATDPTLCGWALCIVEEGEEKPIGTSTLHLHGRSHLATSGIVIYNRDYWRRGVASLAHLMRTYYAVEHFDMIAIYSEAMQNNPASRRALEKTGYCITGVEYNTYRAGGQLHHIDQLMWVNPDRYHWDFFWRGRKAPEEFAEARKRARATLREATQIVSFD